MSTRRFVLLSLALSLVGKCLGRQFIKTELRNSPVGVGVHNALRGTGPFSSLSRNRPSSNRDSGIGFLCRDDTPLEHQSRFASVRGNEAESLGLALTPNLKLKPCQMKNSYQYPSDELEYLEQGALPCSSRSKSTTLPHRERHSAKTMQTSDSRGGNVIAIRPLLFWESMVCGAISRSIAQTVMHPANTMKTILQSSRGVDRPTVSQLMRPAMFKGLTRGAGANFILSVPHGAVNFAVLEFVRGRLNSFVESVPWLEERSEKIGPGLDFSSSAISTICCSVVSTPQMMITDNIMVGNYPRLSAAIRGLYKDRGIMGFYSGWWPGLVGKIPSYAITWTFFQQLKRVRDAISDRSANNVENTIMGCIASATTVCIMMPMDTIKTRLVTQLSSTATTGTAYKGIIDCAVRVAQEEGIRTFYRGLSPRLLSVVPMIGIQFGVYEAMKKVMVQRKLSKERTGLLIEHYGAEQAIEEAAMEVAASPEHPYPAPRFLERIVMKKQSLKVFGAK